MVRYLLCLHLGGNDQTVVKAVCKVRMCDGEGVRWVSECKIRVWRGQSCIQGFSVGWTLPEHIMCSDDLVLFSSVDAVLSLCMLAVDWKVQVNRELVSSIVNLLLVVLHMVF